MAAKDHSIFNIILDTKGWCTCQGIMWRGFLLLAVVTLLLTGCALHEEIVPAVPVERTIFQPPPVQVETPPEPTSIAEGIPPSMMPVVQPTAEELRAFKPKPASKTPDKPEAVIGAANKGSTVVPSTSGYADSKSSIQHYGYLPGRIYEVYTSPNNPTAIILPKGDRLAAAPAINPEAFDVGVIEIGEGEQRQEAVIVRPLAAGQEATTHIFTQAGRAFFLRLKSFEKTSMVAVTWDVPQLPHLLTPPSQILESNRAGRATVVGKGSLFPLRPRESSSAGESQGIALDISRLHTAYTIEAIKGKPPWLPMAIYDDGSRTIIRFREPLNFTQAPAPFATNADGTPSLVQFTPYSVPDDPEKGAYYIINGLYPRIDLKGGDGQIVRITRQTGQPKPYKEGTTP